MAAVTATSQPLHHSSLTSVSLSLASRADRGPLVLSLILSLSWMAFIQASAFSTLLSNSSCSCWVIAFEEAERIRNREVSRFCLRPQQECIQGNLKEQGRKANDAVAFLFNDNTKKRSSIAIQLSTENTFTPQPSEMKIYQETKRRWGTVGGSITVKIFNSKLSNEINLVFVVYSRLTAAITNTFCLFPEPSQYKTLPMPFQAHVLSIWRQTTRALQHMLNLEVYKPFKAGEIRIRCLGLQFTCSAETVDKLSKCTCTESGIHRRQELASNCQDKPLTSHHMGISTLIDFFFCHLFYDIPGSKLLNFPKF